MSRYRPPLLSARTWISRRFPELAALAALAALLVVNLAHHEMWFDETHSWAIARSSHSLGDLISNMQYEGTPPLWHLLLFGLTRVSGDVRLMQVLSGAFAITSVALVLFAAPWSRLVRILVACGYFFVFEYAVLSRSYVVSVTLLLAALVLQPGTRDRSDTAARWVLWVAALVLLALTSALAAVLAFALAATTCLDLVRRRPERVRLGVAVIAFMSLLMVGIGLFSQQPADGMSGKGIGQTLAPERIDRVIASLHAPSSALLPVPEGSHAWNSLLIGTLDPYVWAALSVALLVALGFAVRTSRLAWWMWVGGSIGLIGFFALVYPPDFLRHSGHFALLALATAWLWSIDPNRAPTPTPVWVRGAVWALLAVQVLTGVLIVGHFLRTPFTDSAPVADAITARVSDPLLVSGADGVTTSVAAYLDRPFLSAATDRRIRFITYDRASFLARQRSTDADALAVAQRVADQRDRTVVLILTQDIHEQRGIRRLDTFTPVYLVEPTDS